MSHFITGPIVDNEPDWLSNHINNMPHQDRVTCAAYQKLIRFGYFPLDNYFATNMTDLEQWANNDLMMHSEQKVVIMSIAIKKGMSK